MLLLKNGLLNCMDRPAFVGDILIENGKIVEVGERLKAIGADVVDCDGLYITPGFIDAHCHVGMWEDGMNEEGADGNECSDPITPQMRGLDGVNPFDRCFVEAYESGITTVLTGPGSANVIGGQFLAMKTAGRCLDDMLIKAPAAMKAALGENPKGVYSEQKSSPYTRMAIASLFRETMVEAQEYAHKIALGSEDPEKQPDRDLSLEALLPVLSGTLPMKIHAHRADDILTAFRLADEFDIKISIEHCTEGHLIADVLREKLKNGHTGVVLGPIISERPKIEMRNLDLRAPKILYDAGINFALMTDHPVIPIQYLPLCAALCVREGLPEQSALEAITINAAKITGLSKQIGSITPGKDADIAIFNGPALDVRSKNVCTIINGRIAHNIMM
ncbi:amidohydrolase [Eubacteriales bacterium OttesenSCG-928-K08]|nr:amidohydrolase [Eubacteriales bacterium OttesenSCG-928-K08]